MKKLASGTTARAVKEWVGKTPDQEPPPSVQLRILERQKGKCAITGHKFRPGDKKRRDHIKPLIDGGENRESNLQWILAEPHKAKTKAEAAVRKKVRKRAKTHAGVRAAPARKMESRNDLPEGKHAERAKNRVPPPTHLPTRLERLYGIVEKPRWKK